MPRFELSERTASVVRYLQPLDKGASVSYGDLRKAVGFAVGAKNNHVLYARKILERDHNAVWVCVKPGVGLQRLKDGEIADRLPGWWHHGARNKLRRGGEQADLVDTGTLDIDQQARFAVDSIQNHLAIEALSKATRRRLERVARGTSNDLPAFTAVEWAISLSKRREGK